MEQLREELRAAKTLEDQLRKVCLCFSPSLSLSLIHSICVQADAENAKAMSELNSALGSLKFELKEKLLSLESAAAMQASSAREAASAQAALTAMREELAHAEQEATEAAQMLKMKEVAWEEEKKRLIEERDQLIAQAYECFEE